MPGEHFICVVEAAQAAALLARAVSEGAAITAGVESALAADRRNWAHQLLTRLGSLPTTAIMERELLATLVGEFSVAADEITHRGLFVCPEREGGLM